MGDLLPTYYLEMYKMALSGGFLNLVEFNYVLFSCLVLTYLFVFLLLVRWPYYEAMQLRPDRKSETLLTQPAGFQVHTLSYVHS